MTGALVVAVDVGSTRARAGVFDASGHRLSRAESGFATQRPRPDHAEHGFEDIWRAVCAAVREAVAVAGVGPEAIAGLAFDATCSLALFDREGRPVTVSTTGEDAWNVVMWADHRAIAEAAEIDRTGHRALDGVGGTMSPEMELPKLLWLKRHLPGSWARLAHALDLTDALAWRATGVAAVSACTVTCKWAYLAHAEGWPLDLFAALGLDDLPTRAGLPAQATPVGAPVGRLTADAANALGLTPACLVGAGLIDAHAGGVGLLGHLEPGQFDRHLAMIAGTSTCHMATSLEPRAVPGVWGPYLGAMLPGIWLNEAGQSATGSLLDHILDWHAEGRALGPDRHARIVTRIAELGARDGPDFAGDLHVLPDFHGNRSPLADPHARGVIAGLTLDASLDSLARLYYATAVAIAFGTRHIVEALNAKGYAIDTLHLAGGHVANPLLVRLYADATGCTVALPEEADSVLLGGAAVAATAAGLHASLAAAARAFSRAVDEVRPTAGSAARFDRGYARFLAMHRHRQELARL